MQHWARSKWNVALSCTVEPLHTAHYVRRDVKGNDQMTAPKPVVLCILDGWGLRDEIENNAVALADTPNMDRIMAKCPAHPGRRGWLRVGEGGGPRPGRMPRVGFYLGNEAGPTSNNRWVNSLIRFVQ